MEDYPETVRALSQSTVRALRDEGIVSSTYFRLCIAAASILTAAFIARNITTADIVIIGFLLLLAIILRVVYFIVSCLASIAFWLILLVAALPVLFSVYMFFALLN